VHMGEMISVYKILSGKLEGKRTLGRSRHRWSHCQNTLLQQWEPKSLHHIIATFSLDTIVAFVISSE
jgi:hypothetical protein